MPNNHRSTYARIGSRRINVTIRGRLAGRMVVNKNHAIATVENPLHLSAVKPRSAPSWRAMQIVGHKFAGSVIHGRHVLVLRTVSRTQNASGLLIDALADLPGNGHRLKRIVKALRIHNRGNRETRNSLNHRHQRLVALQGNSQHEKAIRCLFSVTSRSNAQMACDQQKCVQFLHGSSRTAARFHRGSSENQARFKRKSSTFPAPQVRESSHHAPHVRV